MFQFHKVQFKALSVQSTLQLVTEFQFHKVQFKVDLLSWKDAVAYASFNSIRYNLKDWCLIKDLGFKYGFNSIRYNLKCITVLRSVLYTLCFNSIRYNLKTQARGYRTHRHGFNSIRYNLKKKNDYLCNCNHKFQFHKVQFKG